MKGTAAVIFALTFVGTCFGQRVAGFALVDAVGGKTFSLEDRKDSRAVILVFTSLDCPFSKLYEDRIIQLHQDFSDKGFDFAMVNPHLGMEEGESMEIARERANQKKMEFPILDDKEQLLVAQLGITKLPEVVVLTPSPTGWAIAYRGAIDNNPQVAAKANMRYLENALNGIQNRRSPSPASTRPVGCNVRTR